MGIAAEMRHKHILDEVRSSGQLYVKGTSEALGVTEVTVRFIVRCRRSNSIKTMSFLTRWRIQALLFSHLFLWRLLRFFR